VSETGSDYLLSALEAEGITTLFGLVGEGNSHLVDRLHGAELDYHYARHEQVAVMMADGYARTTEFVPYGVYGTADGYLAVVVVADHHWERLCRVVGREELADDERFATARARRDNREAVEEILAERFATATAEEWFERLRERGVPAAPVYDTLEVWEDEHVRARNLLATVPDGNRDANAIRYPVDFDRIDTKIVHGVPDLGEHTREILSAAGVDGDVIEALLAAIDEPS